jgi:hypothetical protein
MPQQTANQFWFASKKIPQEGTEEDGLRCEKNRNLVNYDKEELKDDLVH